MLSNALRQYVGGGPVQMIASAGIVSLSAVLLYLVTCGVPSRDRPADDARTVLAEVSVGRQGQLALALESYRSALGDYPTTAEGLHALVSAPPDAAARARWRRAGGPFVLDKSVLCDPWGHGYIYEHLGSASATPYRLWSVGPDGLPSTADDVSNK